MQKIIALNLGCGNDYRESDDSTEWVNVDNGKCRVDVIVDIEGLDRIEDHFAPSAILEPTKITNLEGRPLTGRRQFRSDLFDHVYACQVLEHINKERFLDVIRELYRISKPEATWEIIVPHGLSDNYVTDPTHKMPFSTRTFDYFVDGEQLRENGIIYGWGDIRLAHINRPAIDGNQSIHFTLRVIKD